MKGVEIEYFTLCAALRKVITFIYWKNKLSDRIPLAEQTHQLINTRAFWHIYCTAKSSVTSHLDSLTQQQFSFWKNSKTSRGSRFVGFSKAGTSANMSEDIICPEISADTGFLNKEKMLHLQSQIWFCLWEGMMIWNILEKGIFSQGSLMQRIDIKFLK